MDFILDKLSLETVGFLELSIRMALAMGFGFILGYERDTKDKPIDFRAFIVVSVATCIIAMVGQELYADYARMDDVVVLDMAKIISGVVTGIGFLGAGAIIHHGDTKIIGTATGASIWAAGIIGMSIGFGLYGLALAGFLAVAFVLIIGGRWMEKNEALDRKDNGDF